MGDQSPPFEEPHPGALTLGANAMLVGAYRWVEYALFELLGSWVTQMPLPAVQVMVDAQSGRHAWHAELWADRLPVLAGVDPDRLTKPSGAVAEVLAALSDGTEESPPGILPRLGVLYRVVLPRLIVTYERHLAIASPVTDGPVIRALRLVLSDEREDWHAGERLVQGLVHRPHDIAAVYEFQQRLESLIVSNSASPGLIPLPA